MSIYPKKIFPLLLLIGCLFPPGIRAQAPDSGLIVPGESVAGLKLGSSFADFETMFPKHPGVDEDEQNHLLNGCPERSYHWLDVDRNATGVYAYFIEGKISLLSVKTPRFGLRSGINIYSPLTLVKNAYPLGNMYVLQGSGSAMVGGKDLWYWVDKSDGVAFELYWDRGKRQRLVGAIDIFSKEAGYLPDGCVSVPQRWEKLSN